MENFISDVMRGGEWHLCGYTHYLSVHVCMCASDTLARSSFALSFIHLSVLSSGKHQPPKCTIL